MSEIVSFRLDSDKTPTAREAVARVEAEVAAAYYERLSQAGWLRRRILAYQMRCELNNRLEKLAVFLPYYLARDARRAAHHKDGSGDSRPVLRIGD